MSLLGIDAGTSGCKAAVFSPEGTPLAEAHEEYDCLAARPGWAELDTRDVWARIKSVIRRVVADTRDDPVTALSVSSLGEAVVPVTLERGILGPSLLNFDVRGEEYVAPLASQMDETRLYRISGNTLGNQYTLTKLLWIRDHQPELFEETGLFLPWGGFVSFMLGADPVVDYSLANRTLLFDVEKETWSGELLSWAGLDGSRLPAAMPAGTVIGEVSAEAAEELGLGPGTAIVAGAHDQCANGLGCGVLDEGTAMFGMGTYICVMPVFKRRPAPEPMLERGLNAEHHSVPDRFVCFIYNHGGSLVKWYRDTFAVKEHDVASAEGRSVYPDLMKELPEGPSGVYVLPHFTATGPPHFLSDSSGLICGLKLETSRGQILKGLMESAVFYLRQCMQSLPATGIAVNDFRAAGGGSRSDAWLQLCADILNRPLTRGRVTEAGTLGAAMLAGLGTGVFGSAGQAVEAMVAADRTFEPDAANHERYARHYQTYCELWPAMKDVLLTLPR